MANDMVIIRVTAGYRLPRPADCPKDVYNKLMMRCWNADPTLRPTFAALMASSTLASQGGVGTKKALAHAVSMHRDSRLTVVSGSGAVSASGTVSSSLSGNATQSSGIHNGNRGSDQHGSRGASGSTPVVAQRKLISGGSLYLSLEGASGAIIEADRDLPSPNHTAHVNRAGVISIHNGPTEFDSQGYARLDGMAEQEEQQTSTAIFFTC